VASPFLGEIDILPYNFAPQGYAACNGQLLPIAQFTALFSLLGTTYGGDGRSTFALPNFQGAAPVHAGQGNGLSNYDLGQAGGSPTETLTVVQLPLHDHVAQCESAGGVASPSVTEIWGGGGRGRPAAYVAPGSPTLIAMNASALAAAGGGQPHNNLSPFVGFMFCIALQGVFPSRG
jgi:microcystin-dependent protein